MPHKKLPSQKKSRKILKHGSVRGRKLTKAQKGLFGVIAGGKKPLKARRKTAGRSRKRR